MPKIVDHEQRKIELAHAAWRVIQREGLEGVTVRSVATEAGISLGSLRHYFDSQSALLSYSMNQVSERVRGRVEALPFTGDPRQDMQQLLEEMLPMDEERYQETKVWFAFYAKTMVDPELSRLGDELHNELYSNLYESLQKIKRGLGQSAPWDPEAEARRLHALLDGLAMHGIRLTQPLEANMMRKIVHRHLDEMFRMNDA
ncbi:hypothetical protein SY83_10055 [Paenibacillus swuensis]|uniref:HTH tetR-type domain-containing protein n=1 Tax=Paenibacillus swuensis TaxID=1178515 RepID=A0A172THX2_9BACL|nr:TetR family transcriptional regulator C-terminal domain-containing protein [Paenibacillus swuensis]ANE46562.1 hypothetical protein SY83_10055 [Paenibacillus swuensis]